MACCAKIMWVRDDLVTSRVPHRAIFQSRERNRRFETARIQNEHADFGKCSSRIAESIGPKEDAGHFRCDICSRRGSHVIGRSCCGNWKPIVSMWNGSSGSRPPLRRDTKDTEPPRRSLLTRACVPGHQDVTKRVIRNTIQGKSPKPFLALSEEKHYCWHNSNPSDYGSINRAKRALRSPKRPGGSRPTSHAGH